jgi:adenosylmethionine-8-amino-7-oxononanoate aminotransferase
MRQSSPVTDWPVSIAGIDDSEGIPVSAPIAASETFDQAQQEHWQRAAADHLWPQFTYLSRFSVGQVPVIVRGEGAWIYDDKGNRYLDALSGLYTVNIGHCRPELAAAAAKQLAELDYFPIWTFAHPRAAELAERIAGLAPADMNRVWFTSSGSESVETAWKLARQYHQLRGNNRKHKALSRAISYHGTTLGALSITGFTGIRDTFEPLVPSTAKVPNTNFYRAPVHADDEIAFGQWAADEIERAILAEGADTVAAVFLEPVQNAGGCFVAPPGYYDRVREICDKYDVLYVSDETICAFGRLGTMFGSERVGAKPDIITSAKGLTSGAIPMGVLIASDKVVEPFRAEGVMFLHGSTFAGHPVAAAVALANLDILEREVIPHANAHEALFRKTIEELRDISVVGDIRGMGHFLAIELVADQATKATIPQERHQELLFDFLSPRLWEEGIYCRADDRGDPTMYLAPPLICGPEEFEFLGRKLRLVLSELADRLARG